jgi:putative Mn2+ efflux pump MntP
MASGQSAFKAVRTPNEMSVFDAPRECVPNTTRLNRLPCSVKNGGVLARIVAFVLPLGLDTLAIAIALGLQGQSPLQPALLFVVFETTMPLIGIAIGRVVGLWFEKPAAYLGGLILLAVGFYTVRESQHRKNEVQRFALDSPRGMILAGLGISMDEIAIGFPLGALRFPIVGVLGAIAIQTFLVTVGGILVGRKINQSLGMQTSRLAGLAAGASFVLLGSYLILERIFSQSNLP